MRNINHIETDQTTHFANFRQRCMQQRTAFQLIKLKKCLIVSNIRVISNHKKLLPYAKKLLKRLRQ